MAGWDVASDTPPVRPPAGDSHSGMTVTARAGSTCEPPPQWSSVAIPKDNVEHRRAGGVGDRSACGTGEARRLLVSASIEPKVLDWAPA